MNRVVRAGSARDLRRRRAASARQDVIEAKGPRPGNSGGVTLIPPTTTVQRPRIVVKPWGHEEIFALVEGKFCGKVLHVRAGHALSLQYHREKEEVICLQRGAARVEVGDSIESLTVHELYVGDTVHIPPGRLHRISALTDAVLLEASTTELDDVVRLADDYGREEQLPSVPAQRGGGVPATAEDGWGGMS